MIFYYNRTWKIQNNKVNVRNENRNSPERWKHKTGNNYPQTPGGKRLPKYGSQSETTIDNWDWLGTIPGLWMTYGISRKKDALVALTLLNTEAACSCSGSYCMAASQMAPYSRSTPAWWRSSDICELRPPHISLWLGQYLGWGKKGASLSCASWWARLG